MAPDVDTCQPPRTAEEWGTRRQRALDQLDLYTRVMPGLLARLAEGAQWCADRLALIGIPADECHAMTPEQRLDALDEVRRLYHDDGRPRRRPLRARREAPDGT